MLVGDEREHDRLRQSSVYNCFAYSAAKNISGLGNAGCECPRCEFICDECKSCRNLG